MQRKREEDVSGYSIDPGNHTKLQNLHPSGDMLYPQVMEIVPFGEKVVGSEQDGEEKERRCDSMPNLS